MKRYDLIVIGAGPAGLLAARSAAENGLEVAVLENKADPTRLNRACGQTLASMNEYLFGNLCQFNSRDQRVSFSTDGFSFKYDGPYLNINSVYSYVASGHYLQLGIPAVQRSKGNAGMVGLAIDKASMLRCLLDEVLAVHGEVFTGVDVKKVIHLEDRVHVEGGGQHYEASYVIAADGTNSRVAAMMGFNEDRDYYCNFYALSYHVSGVNFPEPDVLIRISQFVDDGYSGLFIMPRPDGKYNVIAMTVDPRVNLNAAIEYFMHKSVGAPWFSNAVKHESMAAVCNCYSAIEVPYRNRVLIVGDAASTQELEITGAIISGWKAGQAATTAVLEERIGLKVTGIQQYLDWWRSCYLEGHNPETYIKSFAMPLILSSQEDMNYFFGLIDEPLPACYNPYSSPTARVMKKIYPILERDRPDILAKMKRRSLPAKELYAPLAEISKPV